MQRVTIFALSGLLACSSAASQSSTIRAVVLPESQAMHMLDQCSRQAPRNADGTWLVTPDIVARMESDFPKLIALAQQGNGNIASSKWDPKNFFRQYAGITIHGKQYVYINAFPELASVLPGHDSNAWLKHPVMVCDGGPHFWGVLYAPESGQFSQLSFNGVA